MAITMTPTPPKPSSSSRSAGPVDDGNGTSDEDDDQGNGMLDMEEVEDTGIGTRVLPPPVDVEGADEGDKG